MEPNNNNNNFSSPQKQGVSQGYVQQRVFGERFRENNDRDEAEAQINNNRVQNNELPAFARILNLLQYHRHLLQLRYFQHLG